MAENQTIATRASVSNFLAKVQDKQARADCQTLVKMMQEVTGQKAAMWGPSIVGFGSYHYKYASGREGDMPLTGFSPRKQNLTLYIMGGFDRYESILDELGKFKTGGGCLYLKRLEDVHLPTLKRLIRESVKVMRQAKT
jgi:hypothetical protein